MSRRMSHQAEVERRHMDRGSWSPDDQYCDYEYPDTVFSGHSYNYKNNYKKDETKKITTPGAKSRTVEILTTHWGLSYAEALKVTISIFNQIDIADEHLDKTIYCYMIINELNPRTLAANIPRLKQILRSNNPDGFLSEIINKYQDLNAH